MVEPVANMRQQLVKILATGEFTAREAADQVGVQSESEVTKVRKALWELGRDGLARRVRTTTSAKNRQVTVWTAARPQVSIQEKIWRAACLKTGKGQSFTPGDLARLAGCSRDYAKRFVRFLLEAKYLLQAGKILHQTGRTFTYVVTPGREKGAAPHWGRRAEKLKKAAQPGPDQVQMVEALGRINAFIHEARQIFGETQVRVTATLDSMEMDLTDLAARVIAGPEVEHGNQGRDPDQS